MEIVYIQVDMMLQPIRSQPINGLSAQKNVCCVMEEFIIVSTASHFLIRTKQLQASGNRDWRATTFDFVFVVVKCKNNL